MGWLADQLSSGILIVDHELTVLAWNRWMAEHVAIPPQDAIGRGLDVLLPELPAATLRRRVKATLQLRSPSYLQPRKGYLFQVPLERVVDSHFSWMQQRVRILPDDGEPHHAIIVVDDVTATREAEARAALAAKVSERYLELIDNNVMTLGVDEHGRVSRASSALLEYSGWSGESLAGCSLDELGLGALADLADPVDDEQPERALRGPDGEARWVRVRQAQGLDDARARERYLVLQDISLEKEIQALSERDVLTGVYNRMKFDQLLQEAISAQRRYGHHFAVILCDIDHFKAVNDDHGHLAGDAVLKRFARLLRAQTRSSDKVARWGGEEFVVLLPMAGEQQASAVAEKLRHAIAVEDWPAVGRLTASFGVAACTKHESEDALLDRADAALYQAKAAGRNRVCSAETPPGTGQGD
jgi:diguanylate cyclase (GGDEF)-like protein